MNRLQRVLSCLLLCAHLACTLHAPVSAAAPLSYLQEEIWAK